MVSSLQSGDDDGTTSTAKFFAANDFAQWASGIVSFAAGVTRRSKHCWTIAELCYTTILITPNGLAVDLQHHIFIRWTYVSLCVLAKLCNLVAVLKWDRSIAVDRTKAHDHSRSNGSIFTFQPRRFSWAVPVDSCGCPSSSSAAVAGALLSFVTRTRSARVYLCECSEAAIVCPVNVNILSLLRCVCVHCTSSYTHTHTLPCNWFNWWDTRTRGRTVQTT